MLHLKNSSSLTTLKVKRAAPQTASNVQLVKILGVLSRIHGILLVIAEANSGMQGQGQS